MCDGGKKKSQSSMVSKVLLKLFILQRCFPRWNRPYQDDSTASRPLSEVKHLRVRLVLRWGTTLESLMLISFSFFFIDHFLWRSVCLAHQTIHHLLVLLRTCVRCTRKHSRTTVRTKNGDPWTPQPPTSIDPATNEECSFVSWDRLEKSLAC